MNREQAKKILQAHRPGGQDAHDPLFREALNQVRRDPQLSAWLDQQTRLDAVIGRKLKQFTAPSGMRTQFLETSVPRTFRGRGLTLAMAAGLIGLAVLTGLFLTRPHPGRISAFADYRKHMASVLRQFPRLDMETERIVEMREWLATRHALVEVEIPPALARFPGIGCRTLEWRGKEFALLCFMVDGEAVHLFVFRPSDFPEFEFSSSPEFARVTGMTTAAWERGGIVYLSLTKGDEPFLRRYL